MAEHSTTTNMPPECGFDKGEGVVSREVAEPRHGDHSTVVPVDVVKNAITDPRPRDKSHPALIENESAVSTAATHHNPQLSQLSQSPVSSSSS